MGLLLHYISGFCHPKWPVHFCNYFGTFFCFYWLKESCSLNIFVMKCLKKSLKKKKKAKVKNCIKAILNIKLCSISFGNCGWTKAHKWFSRAETQREELLRNTPSFLLSELRILLLLLWPECSFSLQTDWLLCFPSSLPYSSFNEICLAWISLLAN